MTQKMKKEVYSSESEEHKENNNITLKCKENSNAEEIDTELLENIVDKCA